MSVQPSRAAWLASAAGFAAASTLTSFPRPAAAQTALIHVGAGLIEPQAQAYYARAQGSFKQHGLDVELRTSQNGAATAAAVASGDLQIGVTSVLGFAQAREHGLPFIIIAPGGVHDSRFPGSGVMVPPDSKLTSPKDLNGKTVAVATAGGLDQLITSVLVDKNGGDASTLKFVEIRPVQMVETLLAGRVDAACMEDPELSAARSRTRSLGDGEDAVGKLFVETAWFTTRDWLAKNEDAAKRFRDAIAAAGEWSMANPEKAAAVLQQDLKIERSRATQRFATRTNLEDFQVLLNAAAKYKFIQPVQASSLIWTTR
jgi:NitT/TauT family transport system substrate-binding protein